MSSARWVGRGRVLISHKHTQLVLIRMDFIESIQHLIITREGTCTAVAICSGCPHVASPHCPSPEPIPALRTTGAPQMNHTFPGAPRGDEPQWVQLPLPGVRGLQVLSQPPLGLCTLRSQWMPVPVTSTPARTGRHSLMGQTAPPPTALWPQNSPRDHGFCTSDASQQKKT